MLILLCLIFVIFFTSFAESYEVNFKLSVSDIARLQDAAQLSCLPNSDRGIGLRAMREDWVATTVPGKGGPGGTKTLYTLPDYVISELNEKNLIHLINEFGGAEQNITLEKPSETIIAEPRASYTYQPSMKDENEKAYELWANQQVKDDIIPIRYYRDVYASAGHGAFNFTETADVMWFRTSFIKNYLSIAASKLVCIRVKGDSMIPTIVPGGTAMLHLSDQYEGEGIYLIRQGEELKIKRLQKATVNKVQIISDNKDVYPMVEVDLSNAIEGDFAILGKCVWFAAVIF